jgi:hypothetical protein
MSLNTPLAADPAATPTAPSSPSSHSNEFRGTRPEWLGLRVPDHELPSVNISLDSGDPAQIHMAVPDAVALLRTELKRVFPNLRCTVRVTHRWHGYLRVRIRGVHSAQVAARLRGFLRNFELLRYESELTGDHWHHTVVLPRGGVPCRVSNDVRWVEVEWATLQN